MPIPDWVYNWIEQVDDIKCDESAKENTFTIDPEPCTVEDLYNPTNDQE